MAYRKNQTNAQIVALALKGIEGETSTGNMSTRGPSAWGNTGHMPRAWANLFGERFRAGLVQRVIYSYSTPIAWLDAERGWIIPEETYSVTTSAKHQTHLYRLLGRRIAVPYDATAEDMRRVLMGELVFVSKGYGANRVFTGTRPGPNYVEA